MALVNAIEMNRDGIYWIQTGFEETAIQLYTAGWTTLDFRLPEGLDNSVPVEAARVLQGMNLIPPAAEASRRTERNENMLDLMEDAPVDPVGAAVSAAAAPADQVPEAAESMTPSVHDILPLLIASSNPAFAVASVEMEDFMSPLPWKLKGATRMDYDDDETRESSEDSMFTIYNRGFSFDVANDQVATTSFGWLRCISNLPIVLAYNAGLAHHMQAERHSMDLSYASALSNYQVAHQLLRGQLVCRQFEPELDLVVMALYHNMGHCYEQLDDKEHAMICFDHMFVALSGTNQIHRLTAEEDLFYHERVVLGLAEKGKPAPVA